MSYLSENQFLAIRPDTDKLLERIGYWIPPLPAWQLPKKRPSSSLRIACIVEERLYQGLRFEGQLMLLTPYNWKRILVHAQPDILLMESIWTTATGHWHMAQCPPSPERNELLEIISQARQQSIPTVFWITKGHAYHEHYKDFAHHFDFVFCADPVEAEQLNKEGVKIEMLQPCFQPALYHPIEKNNSNGHSSTLKLLYDGWADLDRMTQELAIVNELKPYGLNIVESRYNIFSNRKNILPDFKDCILGCITTRDRIAILPYVKASVTFEKTLSLPTTQQWMTLEMAACCVPVVHHGTLEESDPRKGVVLESPNREEFLEEFVKFENDEVYRQNKAYSGWRKLCEEHTFSHRMKTLCKTIGIDHGQT